ncbi:MAG: carboxypeptidase regulatory-like domain-containing protein [Vicinamibacterales bacterium]|nr:carboxypeptidase regulatory-like domain-containing protein [Vicinamibacterales bacterium]
MTRTTIVVLLALALAAPASTHAAQARKPAPTTTMTLVVTDGRGTPIEGVTVTATGPIDREGTTVEAGTLRFTGVRAGTYRLRFSHEGFVTFEKEVAWRAGQAAPEVPVTLSDADLPPAPPPAPEPPPPPPPPAPGPARTLSLPGFIEQNFISNREPQKTSSLGCSGLSEALVWQVRDPWLDRLNPDADVMVYVVGGEGALRLADRVVPISAGTFAVVPRGTTYGLTRQGRNPLIVLAIVSGPPCP